jgi:hypothetical protein
MPRVHEGINHRLFAALLQDMKTYLDKYPTKYTDNSAMWAAITNQGITDTDTRKQYYGALKRHFEIEKSKIIKDARENESKVIAKAENLGISDGVRDGADIIEEENL